MQFKTIVAIMQTEQDEGRVLDFAIPLAKRHESHLVGIHAEAMPVPYTSATGFPDTEFLQVSAELNKERAGKLNAAFMDRMRDTGLSFEWRSLETFSGDSALSGLANVRAADLAIAGQREAGGDPAADVGSLVYDAGRPVLVVPHSGPLVTEFKTILVMWNGSREAARAAFDALPFIVEADTTEIFVIDPPESGDDGDATGAEIAASLARHGANVAVVTETSNGQSLEDVIQQRIVATGADLVVLGAYSNSWLRRLLFGGVTNTLLKAGSIAAFLSR